MLEINEVVPKFYEALDVLKIEYDKDTGRLSKTIEIIAYSTNRKIKANRILICKNYFLIIDEQKQDTRKLYFENVKGFKDPDNIIY